MTANRIKHVIIVAIMIVSGLPHLGVKAEGVNSILPDTDALINRSSQSRLGMYYDTPTDNIDYAPKSDVIVGTGSTGVVIGDLDGDGRQDVATSNYGYAGSGSTVTVLRNTGTTGTISFASKVDFIVGSGPHGMDLGDLDGDGKLDLVTANCGSGCEGYTVSVLRNTSSVGAISFAANVEFDVDFGPQNVEIRDLNGDGKPDLAVTNFKNGQGTTVSVLRNTSSVGAISFAPRVTLTTGTGPYGLALGDIDGDGKPDLVAANFGNSGALGSTVSVLRNTSTSGSIAFAAKVDFPTGDGPRGVVLADLDQDGKSDLAVTNFGLGGSGTTVSILRNTSTSGNIAFAAKVDMAAGTGALSVASQDLNNDTKLDLVVANYGTRWPNPTVLGTTVSVLKNVSTSGTITFAPKLDFGTGSGPHDAETGDLDNDGRSDIAVVNYGNGDTNVASILRNTSSASGSTPTSTAIVPTATFTATNTPTNTPVFTSTPTKTAVPPTATYTPTNTPTSTPVFTSTPTNTVVPPTATFTPTSTAIVPTATNTPANTPTSTSTPTNTPTSTRTFTPTPTSTPSSANVLYLSSDTNGIAGGVAFNDEDILSYDSATGIWSLYFDGSDVGLTSDIDSFSLMNDGSILISLDSDVTVGNLGTVADSDIIRFIPTALGANTAGSFQWYFDGSDVGLTTVAEDLDAIGFAPDGKLIISTGGSVSVTGVSGNDEDLLAFTATSLGSTTAGTWSLYFDGSDVELNESASEEINEIWIDPVNNNIYMTTVGSFSVTGVNGTGSDIFVCIPNTLGSNTSCTYNSYWRGAQYGFAGEIVDGLDIRRLP